MKQRLVNAQNDELSKLLFGLTQQKLSEAQAQEQELLEKYNQAEVEAVGLNNRMAELQIAENELQRLRNLHETLLNRMSNVNINQDQADVRVAIVGEAAASDRPVSPKLSWVTVFCLISGLTVGALVVYVLDLLDDSFQSPEELTDQLGLPVLAMVRKLPVTTGEGAAAVQVHANPSAVESEVFRTLRTVLALSDHEIERIAVTSSVPGDGKTTILANFAAACAQAGKKTLAIDADLRRPGLSKMFGMRGRPGLCEILRSDENIASACRQRIQHSGIENFDVLAGGPRPPDPVELLSRPRLAEVVAWAENAYDQVLIDCPPVLAASDAALVGRLVDGVLLVVRPDENHRRAVVRAVEGLAAMQVNLVGVVTNCIRSDNQSPYYGYGTGYGYGLGYGHGSGYEYGREAGELDETILDVAPATVSDPRLATVVPRRVA